MNNIQSCLGIVKARIEYIDGREDFLCFKNTILQNGREALARCLANEIGDTFNNYISNMVFGNGGTSGGSPKIVGSARSGLFGATVAIKPVIVSLPDDISTQVVFTTVLRFDDDEANTTINEMALMMANGDLYSLATFADLNKTDQMQITWNWSITMI